MFEKYTNILYTTASFFTKSETDPDHDPHWDSYWDMWEGRDGVSIIDKWENALSQKAEELGIDKSIFAGFYQHAANLLEPTPAEKAVDTEYSKTGVQKIKELNQKFETHPEDFISALIKHYTNK